MRPALKSLHGGHVYPQSVSELLLGPAAVAAQLSDPSADRSSQGLTHGPNARSIDRSRYTDKFASLSW
ncbi:MAG: hypothetical protein ACRELB_17895 [Polyangiaceae bacterium]